jgi:hypothetical protein
MTTKLEGDLQALFRAQTRSLGLGEPPPLDDTIVVHGVGPRNRHRPLAFAAALVLIVGGAALWWAIDTRGEMTPADQPGSGLMPTEPPLFRLDAAGWTPASFTEVDPAPSGEGSTTFIVDGQGLLGPRLNVYLSDAGSMPISDAEPDQITIAGAPARLLVDGDRAQVHWTEPGGHILEAVGTAISVDDLIAAAEEITVDDQGLPSATGPLPAGLVPLTGRDAALARSFYEYRWIDSTGLELQASLYPGGRPVYEERIGSLGGAIEDRTVGFQGADAYVARDENMIRLDQLRGFWVLEISGGPQTYNDPTSGELSTADAKFESIDELLTVAEQLLTVDATAWRAALPADIVLRSEVGDVAAELAVFPMPDGQAAPTVADNGFTEQRAGIAQSIAVQTTCAWTTVVLDAAARNDPEAAIAAAEIIHDVATWTELSGIGDTISGTDRVALTAAGRVRALDAAFGDLRQFDVEDEESDIDDLELDTAVADVFATDGIDLECAS